MSDDVSRDDLAWKEACRREWSICELLRRHLARLTDRNYWRGHLPIGTTGRPYRDHQYDSGATSCDVQDAENPLRFH